MKKSNGWHLLSITNLVIVYCLYFFLVKGKETEIVVYSLISNLILTIGFLIVAVIKRNYSEKVYPSQSQEQWNEMSRPGEDETYENIVANKIPQQNDKYYECPECGLAVPHGMNCHHNLHG